MCHLLNFQKILMVRHKNKNVVNMKQRNFKKFFKPLIKRNIKYLKFNQFLNYCTHNKNEIKGSPKLREKVKRTS